MNRAYLAALLGAALTAAALLSCGRSERSTTYAGAPVIVVSIDTLRADRLPAYGYKGVATPALDALRADSVLFENAYAHVPLTLPSHATMLTGTLPPANGVRNNIGYRFDASQPHLPGALRASGYKSGAAVSAYVLRGATGLRNAFDFYDDGIAAQAEVPVGMLQRPGVDALRAAQTWIDAQGSSPFFFLLHIFEPHTPYEPTYDADVAAADRVVGELTSYLKARGLYDKAVVVILSDHGEGLGDHGEDEHGIFLYREALHVPLFVKLPGNARANTSVKNPAQLIDLFPTIAALAGANVPADLPGASLLDLDSKPARAVYAETLYPRIHLGWSALRSLVDAKHHFIEAPRAELFDVTSDPREQRDLASTERRTAARFRELLQPYGDLAAPVTNIDPEEAAKLAALGYLGSATTATGPLPDPKERIGDLRAVREAAHSATRGEVLAAIASLKSVVARSPHFTDAWVLLAQQQEQAGEYGDAVESYRRAMQLSPSLVPELALSLAATYTNLGNLDEAEKSANAVAKTSGAAASVALARIALTRGNFADAERHARTALDDATQRDRARVLLAEALGGQQRFAEGLSVLSDMKPVVGAHFVRGDLLARMNRLDEAKAAFRAEIAAFPRERRAYASLAVVQWMEGDRAAARATLSEFTRALPVPASRAFADKVLSELAR
ncbi:MAG TPA: sulfatase-like hydrolase/transferase [Thermoanaerobaculia bacterium]|jgi:tetratricopeptide (TPR) repeat protein